MEQKPKTADTLPKRRGVVIREFGIADTYGKRYIRCPRVGGLVRANRKPR